MSDIVISVENLGKRYKIRHQQQERYTTLRDLVVNRCKSIFTNSNIKINRSSTVEEFWALKNISFDIKQGETIGVIGRNGAGKSTLLKILSRITEPTTGRVRIRGRIASLLEVGTGFHPELTGRENIFLNGAVLGMQRLEIRQKFDEIVAYAEIEKFLDTPVKRYSSGMYMRLAFAIAAHLEPEILIVDEVLAVGDAEFQKKCLGKMKDISYQQGRTVLFVSHNLSAIKSLCTVGLCLESGRVEYSGNVDEAVSRYVYCGSSEDLQGVIPDDMPRLFETGEAKFRSAYLFNRENQKTHQVAFREKLRFELVLDVFEEISDCLLDLKICAEDGMVLTHSVNSLDDCISINFGRGRYKIEVEVENILQPGKYSLTIGAHHSTNGTATIDYVEQVWHFQVEKISIDGQQDYPYSFVFGFVRPPAKWNIIDK